MTKKTLLASGCSFTDYDFKSNIHEHEYFDKWPEILANKIGYDHVNAGECGAGNGLIVSNTIDAIIKKKPDLVCVLWSGFDRFSTFNFEHCPVGALYTNNKKFPLGFYREMLNNDDGTSADLSLHHMYMLQEYLKAKEIPYIFYQGVDPYIYSCMKELYRNKIVKNYRFSKPEKFSIRILSSPYHDLIDENNCIGFPFDNNIGGECFRREYIKNNETKYRLSEQDGHPSAIGHEKIAEIYYEKLLDNGYI